MSPSPCSMTPGLRTGRRGRETCLHSEGNCWSALQLPSSPDSVPLFPVGESTLAVAAGAWPRCTIRETRECPHSGGASSRRSTSPHSPREGSGPPWG